MTNENTSQQTALKVTIEAGGMQMQYDFKSMKFIATQDGTYLNGGTFTLESFTQQMKALTKGLKDRGY